MVRLECEQVIQNLFPVEIRFGVCMFSVKRNNTRRPISIVIRSIKIINYMTPNSCFVALLVSYFKKKTPFLMKKNRKKKNQNYQI